MASLSLINASTTLICLQSSSSSFVSGNKQLLNAPGAASTRMLALRAQPVCKSQDGFSAESISKEVKKVAAAAAAALLLSGSVADATFAITGNASLGSITELSSDNPLGSAEDILNKAKQVGNDNFAQAQRTGAETLGETASAPAETAPPAISQLNLKDEGTSTPNSDAIAARADFASENAPGTSQQEGKALNPIEKAFATPTRGIGDKLGENVAQLSNRDEKNKNEIPGQGTSGDSSPGVFEGLFSTLRESAGNRDGQKPATQNVYGTDAS
ncbi:hypothetical protein Mapa_013285 [Marchantia paleacea]|nr:hypothetical protein Mapa_013285 [Marchantia paleacea]